ncbi:MAG: hypothetical protein LUG66_02680 [Clostridiales bacterium]|nr:hypothetical protein [Clostridiales bacterium]
MAASGKRNLDEQINKLKEQKEKKEQGLDYRVDNIFADEKSSQKKGAASKTAEAAVPESNPYVKQVTLDELIDRSRAAKGQKPVERMKKTPFLSREKEIKTPELQQRAK